MTAATAAVWMPLGRKRDGQNVNSPHLAALLFLHVVVLVLVIQQSALLTTYRYTSSVATIAVGSTSDSTITATEQTSSNDRHVTSVTKDSNGIETASTFNTSQGKQPASSPSLPPSVSHHRNNAESLSSSLHSPDGGADNGRGGINAPDTGALQPQIVDHTPTARVSSAPPDGRAPSRTVPPTTAPSLVGINRSDNENNTTTSPSADGKIIANSSIDSRGDETTAVPVPAPAPAPALDDVCPVVSNCTALQRLDGQAHRNLADMFRTLPPSFYHDSNTAAITNDTDTSDNSTSSTTEKVATAAVLFPYAICDVSMRGTFVLHFPHLMQYFYRCWSWWRLHSDKTPVLLFIRDYMPPNSFVAGLVQGLADSSNSIGLQVMSPGNRRHVAHLDGLDAQWRDRYVVTPRIPSVAVDPADIFGMRDPTLPYYAFFQANDAQHLRSLLWQQHALQQNGTNSDTSTSQAEHGLWPNITTNKRRPRIAILNRHHTRQWLNAPAFVDRFVQQTGDLYRANDIPIVYFNDSTPFAEQFELFYHTDILISPHGAQLTGLPFMPPTCGTVLEVMPRGYYLPHFFGSLARAANLKHGTVSLTESGDSRQESIDGMRHMAARSHYRKQQLCPDTNGIVDAVLQLVDEWQQCVTTASTIATQ